MIAWAKPYWTALIGFAGLAIMAAAWHAGVSRPETVLQEISSHASIGAE
ncbi:hypothetical protein WG901_20755 [Novosphingobium sp. PS1R-30]|uniref:Uncharacterized protein n=1 Tax=Novosphingobium anseongense TaxID=3133436 RepID=A0ABU8S165_9SPHN